MAIESICKGCAKKLRVADEYAGRKARCPHCKTVYTVPTATVPPEIEFSQPDSPFDESVTATDDSTQWRVRTEDGAIYGPVPKAELDQWVHEGRVAAKTELQMITARTNSFNGDDVSARIPRQPFLPASADPSSLISYARRRLNSRKTLPPPVPAR